MFTVIQSTITVDFMGDSRVTFFLKFDPHPPP